MKSNYKPIDTTLYHFSDLIEEVTEYNTNLQYDLSDIVGVTIDKRLISTIANLSQTALDKFYIVKPETFVYNPRTHGVKLGMGFNQTTETYITSWNNVAFRVKEAALKVLNPLYLWLYFNREEWDRETNYRAWGSSTIVFAWNTFLSMSLRLPPKSYQDKICEQYSIIADRIALKQRINDNFIQLGINIISQEIGTATLINKMQSEIQSISLPNDWRVETVAQFCIETKSGSTPSRDEKSYWFNGSIPWLKSGEVHNNITIQTEEKITPIAVTETSVKLLPQDTVLMAMYGVTAGEVGYLAIPATTNQAICGMVCHSKDEAAYLFFTLLQSKEEASRLSNGGAQDNLSKNFIDSISIIVPDIQSIQSLHLAELIEQIKLNTKEIRVLSVMQDTLLATISSQ